MIGPSGRIEPGGVFMLIDYEGGMQRFSQGPSDPLLLPMFDPFFGHPPPFLRLSSGQWGKMA